MSGGKMPIDYSRYPENWKTEIVPAIKKRSGNKCEICGLNNGQTVHSLKLNIRDKKTGRYKEKSLWLTDEADVLHAQYFNLGRIKKVRVILTVAHLDHDEENHNVSLDRLQHMCQRCHLNYDANEKWERQKKKWKKE